MLSLNSLVLIASLLYPACNVELHDGSSIFANNTKAALAKMLTEKCNDSSSYEYCMTNGVKHMAGATRWRKMVASGKEKPMNVATPSDKAMMMLVYENYIGHWVDKFNGMTPACKTKYTKEVGARYGDWSDEGLEWFNELLVQVKADQESQNGIKAEESYQRARLSAAKATGSKRRRVTMESRVCVANDLADLGDSTDSEDDINA